jgi:hypothetical protein
MNRFLKYLLITITIFIVLFFLGGLIRPSVQFGHEITVNKPVDEAWAVTQDESKLSQWLEGFKSMELISGEYGAIGSKYKVIVKPDEEQPDFEMIETIMDFQEYDHFDLNFESDMIIFDQTMSFESSGEKTKIKTESVARGKSLVTRAMFAWMDLLGNTFQNQEERNMEALKVVIEDNTVDYYPPAAAEESDSTGIGEVQQ